MEKLLDVKNLKTSFKTHIGDVQAVREVSFYLNKGEAIGVVGESGCGKSVSMMSLMRLLPDNAVIGGEAYFNDEELISLPENKMQSVRGNEISMIFQDPMTSLNPILRIGDQLAEPLVKHRGFKKKDAYTEVIKMLDLVGIPSPEKRLKQFPHEFSGGMRQRAMIAMSLICKPQLIIADEPTTALDVTIQAQILDLMKDLKDKIDSSIILITHDLGVVADLCTRIYVMYGGIIVEEGTDEEIFYNSKHPYTWGLLRSVPNPKSELKEKLIPIEGQPPDLLKPPAGCPFVSRCDYVMKVCLENRPPLFDIENEHKAACWLCHEHAKEIRKSIAEEVNNG